MQLNSESYRGKMKIWEASSLVLSFRKRERCYRRGRGSKALGSATQFQSQEKPSGLSNGTEEESDSYLLRNGEIREQVNS